MSDEDLRALERAFAARPDPETRRAFVAALVRVGEGRRAVAMLAEAARGGDADARAALDAWHPWPGPAGAGGRRAGGPVAGPLVEVASAGHPLELDTVLGATAADLLVLGRDERGACRVLGLDLGTLRARWSIEAGPIAGAALAGEDLVVVSRTRLRAHSPVDGALRGEVTLPAEGRAVVGADDRAVVLLCAPDRARLGLACVDLRGPAPALAWRLDARPANTPLLVHGDRVGASGVCVRLVDGSPAPPLEADPPSTLLLDPSWSQDTLLTRVADVELVVSTAGVRVLGTPRGEQPGPELVARARAGGAVAWRRPLPAWAGGVGGRAAVAAAGDEVLVLLTTEERVALIVVGAADGAVRREVPTTLRGRGLWDHRSPTRAALVVAGGGAIGLVPASQGHFVQVVRLAATPVEAQRPRRGPLPGSPTPTLGAREGFEVDGSAWRTADGRAVVPAATVAYDFQWAKGGRVWPPVSGDVALVTLACAGVVLDPEPASTELALLVDLTRRAVAVLPLTGTVRAVVPAPAGLVLAEGDHTRPGDFRAGGFGGCRVSGWEVPSGRRAFARDLGEAVPRALSPRADGSLEVRVDVERSDSDELEPATRVLDPGVPGWGAAPAQDAARELEAARAGVELALEWPAPAARGVLEVRRRGRGKEVVPLAAELPERGPPRAAHGEVVVAWADEEAVRVTRGGAEVARLVLPRDVHPGSIRAASTPRPAGGREPPGSARYVPVPPVVLGVSLDGAHVLAVVVPSDAPVKQWTAVTWSLDEPGAPLGQVPLGPAFLPPPRAILPAAPGRLRLDLGRGVVLAARHDGPLAAVAWAPSG